MDKSEDAFRTIGEMSRELGVKTHILRYWEEQFPTLNPLKRAGGRRHYRREDVMLLKQINRLLNDEGYTIKGARKALMSNGLRQDIASVNGQAAPAAAMQNGSAMAGIDLAKLRAVRDQLASALASA